MSEGTELPIAWEVSGVDGRKFYVDGYKLPRYRKRFPRKAQADQRKVELQEDGWVATVTPVYISKKARSAAARARQSEPLGRFNENWKLAR
jgi:hypothetical protein